MVARDVTRAPVAPRNLGQPTAVPAHQLASAYKLFGKPEKQGGLFSRIRISKQKTLVGKLLFGCS